MGVNEMIRTGLMLSRAKILFHKHNDMEDLERVLKSVRDQDEKMGKKKSFNTHICFGLLGK
jgi:serine palmitoyltransferase